jgi:exosortase N
VIASIVIVVIGGMMAFPLDYFSNLNVLLGVCLLPFSIWITGRQRVNYFYLLAMICFGALASVYPVKIFYFFAIAIFILFLLEIHIGQVNTIVLFLLAFMSPFFEQVAGILGFPIRLYLSNAAGSILTVAGLPVGVEGNMLILHGNSFTVDDACMGLNMLSTSLLVGVLMIVCQYRQRTSVLSFLSLAGYFAGVFLLNVVSNLFRILILVTFNIGPEHPLHGVTGIVCLALYTTIPTYYFSRWMIVQFGKLSDDRTYQQTPVMIKTAAAMIAVFILWIGIQFTEDKAKMHVAKASVSFADETGFKTDHLQDNVVKISNDDVLIYIKPIAEFFSGEHTPLFCWKGSGYQFKHVRKSRVAGHEVYSGEMVKPGGRLWTAWWYSNGRVVTIDQFDWRLRMMKGENGFYLLNITAEDEETMLKYAAAVLAEPVKLLTGE